MSICMRPLRDSNSQVFGFLFYLICHSFLPFPFKFSRQFCMMQKAQAWERKVQSKDLKTSHCLTVWSFSWTNQIVAKENFIDLSSDSNAIWGMSERCYQSSTRETFLCISRLDFYISSKIFKLQTSACSKMSNIWTTCRTISWIGLKCFMEVFFLVSIVSQCKIYTDRAACNFLFWHVSA